MLQRARRKTLSCTPARPDLDPSTMPLLPTISRSASCSCATASNASAGSSRRAYVERFHPLRKRGSGGRGQHHLGVGRRLKLAIRAHHVQHAPRGRASAIAVLSALTAVCESATPTTIVLIGRMGATSSNAGDPTPAATR